MIAEDDDKVKIAKRKEQITETEEEPPHAMRMKNLLKHPLDPLTKREYHVTDCVMRGLRRAEIAQEMGIEPVSVTQYLNKIYNKFDIHSRKELFALAETLEREITKIAE